MRLTILAVFCGIATIILSGFNLSLIERGSAQSGSGSVKWDTPILVYETTGDISSPNLVTDEFGRLHLLFSQSHYPFGRGQGDYAIFYTQHVDNRWQTPVDILVDPWLNNANTTDLAVLSNGHGEISYQGYPGQQNFSLSPNPDSQFDDVHAWQQPVAVTDMNVTSHSLTAGAGDRLYLVFGSVGSGNMLSFTSMDGNIWNEPVSIAGLPANESVLSTDILIGEDGRLHVFWTSTAYPSGYPPLASYYITSIDEGESWSSPVKIGGADIALGGAAIFNSHIHVLLIGRAGVPGRYDAWSSNGGESWSPLILVDRAGAGLSGGNIVADSLGGFHAAFGSAVDSQVVVVHWDGVGWSDPVNIEQGIPRTLEDIDLEILNGNQLVVVFVQGHTRLWAVHGLIHGAPQIDSNGLPELPNLVPTLVQDQLKATAGPVEQQAFLNETSIAIDEAVTFPVIAVILPSGIVLLVFVGKKLSSRR